MAYRKLTPQEKKANNEARRLKSREKRKMNRRQQKIDKRNKKAQKEAEAAAAAAPSNTISLPFRPMPGSSLPAPSAPSPQVTTTSAPYTPFPNTQTGLSTHLDHERQQSPPHTSLAAILGTHRAVEEDTGDGATTWSVDTQLDTPLGDSEVRRAYWMGVRHGLKTEGQARDLAVRTKNPAGINKEEGEHGDQGEVVGGDDDEMEDGGVDGGC